MWVVGVSHETTGFIFFEDQQEDEALAYYESQVHCKRRFIAKVRKAEFPVIDIPKKGKNGGISMKNGVVKTTSGRRIINEPMAIKNEEIKKLIAEARIGWFCMKCGFAYDIHETRNRVGEPIVDKDHAFVGSLTWQLADVLEKMLENNANSN